MGESVKPDSHRKRLRWVRSSAADPGHESQCAVVQFSPDAKPALLFFHASRSAAASVVQAGSQRLENTVDPVDFHHNIQRVVFSFYTCCCI